MKISYAKCMRCGFVYAYSQTEASLRAFRTGCPICPECGSSEHFFVDENRVAKAAKEVKE